MKYEIRIINENNIFAMLPVSITRPNLEGSEKQIAWADNILNTFEKHIATRNNCHALRLPKGIDINDPRMESALDAHAQNIQAQYNTFFTNKKAAFYIDKLKNINEQTDTDRLQAIIMTYR